MSARGSVILIDNFDSFTFNLVDTFWRLGREVHTFRNTASASMVLARAAAAEGATIVLSPGPGRPEDAGCCLELIERARGKVGVLGVCLGHQALLLAAGAEVERAPQPVHGQASPLIHDGEGPFAGLPNPLRVGRYHSLGVRSPPAHIHVHGTVDTMAFAIADRDARQLGFQFHPESLLTPDGDRLLGQALSVLSAPQGRSAA